MQYYRESEREVEEEERVARMPPTYLTSCCCCLVFSCNLTGQPSSSIMHLPLTMPPALTWPIRAIMALTALQRPPTSRWKSPFRSIIVILSRKSSTLTNAGTTACKRQHMNASSWLVRFGVELASVRATLTSGPKAYRYVVTSFKSRVKASRVKAGCSSKLIERDSEKHRERLF